MILHGVLDQMGFWHQIDRADTWLYIKLVQPRSTVRLNSILTLSIFNNLFLLLIRGLWIMIPLCNLSVCRRLFGNSFEGPIPSFSNLTMLTDLWVLHTCYFILLFVFNYILVRAAQEIFFIHSLFFYWIVTVVFWKVIVVKP